MRADGWRDVAVSVDARRWAKRAYAAAVLTGAAQSIGGFGLMWVAASDPSRFPFLLRHHTELWFAQLMVLLLFLTMGGLGTLAASRFPIELTVHRVRVGGFVARRSEVREVTWDGERLCVSLRDGRLHRSPRLQPPDGLQEALAAYAALPEVADDERPPPPEVDRLRGAANPRLSSDGTEDPGGARRAPAPGGRSVSREAG